MYRATVKSYFVVKYHMCNKIYIFFLIQLSGKCEMQNFITSKISWNYVNVKISSQQCSLGPSAF